MLDFFSEFQGAFYADNADVTEAATLTALACDLGVEGDAFGAHFETDEVRQATIDDFQNARSLGITGFPTVLAKNDKGYAYLTLDYQPYEQLGALLDAWLNRRVVRRVVQC